MKSLIHFLVLLLAMSGVASAQAVQWVTDGGGFKAAVQAGQTGSVRMAVGTTAQRPSTPATGDTRWNTTTSKWEVYDGSGWRNWQDYDSDLDTWSGITPASGVGTFLATPSSANLVSAVTDETGNGSLVFSNTPDFTTDIEVWSGSRRTKLSAGASSGTLYGGLASTEFLNLYSNTSKDAYVNIGDWAYFYGSSSGFPSTLRLLGTIELGHISDTTLARSAAGKVTIEGSEVLVSGGALGTPSSGTLTNCTGLPAAGLVASTTQAVGFGSVEMGHATDTTLARADSGQVTVEGFPVILDLGDSEVGTSETTTSATPVDLTTADSVSFTLSAAADVEIFGDVEVSSNTATAIAYLAVDIDGSDVKTKYQTCDTASGLYPHTILHVASLAAGAHTVKLQYATNAGTLTVRSRTLTCKQK